MYEWHILVSIVSCKCRLVQKILHDLINLISDISTDLRRCYYFDRTMSRAKSSGFLGPSALAWPRFVGDSAVLASWPRFVGNSAVLASWPRFGNSAVLALWPRAADAWQSGFTWTGAWPDARRAGRTWRSPVGRKPVEDRALELILFLLWSWNLKLESSSSLIQKNYSF